MPNIEGGIETHAEQLYPRLARLGCEVDILVRTPFVPAGCRQFGAIRLKRLWAPRRPGLEAFIHSMLGVFYAAVTRPDILHIHAIGPAIVTPIARLFGLTVIVTNHGPDYERDKWGPIARSVLRLGERVGMRYAHARIVISKVIADLVLAKYGLQSDLIPNGVEIHEPPGDTDQIERLGLRAGRYFLQVGRLVPEKRQLDTIRAYARVAPRDWQLAIVGRLMEDPYSKAVAAAAQEEGVILTGFQSGSALQQVYAHAGAFVLPSSHEGLPIALLEALSYGVPVVASNIPANLAIGLEPSSYFPLGELDALARQMTIVSSQPVDSASRAERRRWVAERYDWDRIAEQTLDLYSKTLAAYS
jgi:glycosyltransferase involved in cell wall biosynthesis